MNALYNEQLKHKREEVAKALKNKNWSLHIALHERPYRWNALQAWTWRLGNKALAEAFGWVWTDSENIWQHRKIIRNLVPLVSSYRKWIMDEEERVFFRDLPQVMIAYRGHQTVNRDGMSWTLDRDKALWFAQRYARGTYGVLSAQIKKRDVLFYADGRNESELVVLPDAQIKILDDEMEVK